MSAFLCSEKHIGALVDAAIAYKTIKADYDGVFAMLLAENVASMAARYPTDTATGDIAKSYKYHRRLPRKAIDVLKLIASYEYQSCEHTEWICSEAAFFCERLRLAAIHYLPDYDAAPWTL